MRRKGVCEGLCPWQRMAGVSYETTLLATETNAPLKLCVLACANDTRCIAFTRPVGITG